MRVLPMKMKIVEMGMVLATVALLSFGCTQERQRSSQGTAQTANRSSDEPHFQLSPEKLKQLREQTATLELGEDRTKAITTLGSPSRQQLDGPKKGVDWTCRRLIYDVTVIQGSPGNIRDRSVELAFDRQDRLVQILSTVDGIPSRGDMSACR